MPFTDYGFSVQVLFDEEDKDFNQVILKIMDPCENEKVFKTNIKEPGNYQEFVTLSLPVLEKEIRKILYLKDNF